MIAVDVPGHGPVRIARVVSDYTGTLACGGVLAPSVRERLVRLASAVEIIVMTSDTFGTAQRELAGLPVSVHLLTGAGHDEQKAAFARAHEPAEIAAFGNGANDRLLLRTVHTAGGVAVAVDNGEGCAQSTIQNAQIVVHGADAALDLLLDTRRLVATLRV